MNKLNFNSNIKCKDEQQLKNKEFIDDFLKYNCLWKINLGNETLEHNNILLYNLDCFISFISNSFDVDYKLKLAICNRMLEDSLTYNKLRKQLDNKERENLFLDIAINVFYDNFLVMCFNLNPNFFTYIYELKNQKNIIFRILQQMISNCVHEDSFDINTLFIPINKMLTDTDNCFPQIPLSYKMIWELAINEVNRNFSKNDISNLKDNKFLKLSRLVQSVCYEEMDIFLIYNNLVIACNGTNSKKRLGDKIVNPDLFTVNYISNIDNIKKTLQFSDGTILKSNQRVCLLKNEKNVVIGLLIFCKDSSFTDGDFKHILEHYKFLGSELTNALKE